MSNSEEICDLKYLNGRFVVGECVIWDDKYNDKPISISFNEEINHQFPVTIQITAKETTEGKTEFDVKIVPILKDEKSLNFVVNNKQNGNANVKK